MAYAQITIGSNTPPESGAILQLKDDGTYSNGGTAKKGLGMPRVELQDLNKLKMGPAAPDLTATGADAHTGLLVYNVNQCIPDENPLGLYVWDGTKWEFVGDDSPSPNVSFFLDDRPQELGAQTYPYRTFGAAGTWMLENLRYVPTDGSIAQSMGTGMSIYNRIAKEYAYPNQKFIGTIPKTWSPAQGLLYTYSAATAGVNDNRTTVQEVQTSSSIPGSQEVENTGPLGTAPNKYIQGICPPGWHIPSDREWNTLEKEIYENPTKYSTYTEIPNTWLPKSWNPTWNNAFSTTRGSSDRYNGHSTAMKSVCPPNTSSYNTERKSLPAKKEDLPHF